MILHRPLHRVETVGGGADIKDLLLAKTGTLCHNGSMFRWKTALGLVTGMLLAATGAFAHETYASYDPWADEYDQSANWGESDDITGEVDTSSFSGGVEAPFYPGMRGHWLVSFTPGQAPNAFERHRAGAYAYIARQRARR